MTYTAIILAAAKTAKISGALLIAICSHESGLKNIMVEKDGHSPSYGLCMVKLETAQMLGFHGKPKDLMVPAINARYAAKYLTYQSKRYGEDDWCKLVSAYNAGSFIESKKSHGKPKNLKYVRKVQKKLEENLQSRLSCEYSDVAEAQ